MVTKIRFHCSRCSYSTPQFKEIVEHYEREHNPKPDPRIVRELSDLKDMREASRWK